MHSECPITRTLAEKSGSACAAPLGERTMAILAGGAVFKPMAADDGVPAAPGPILWHWVNLQFQQVLRAFLGTG
jgi:hypothetical protein